MPIEIRMLGKGDHAALARCAEGVFDNPVDPRLAQQFLADPRHHLAVALEDGIVVGFASAVDYIHPDKPRQLWINEVGVAATHRERGVGKAVLGEMLAHGRALGCTEAWVLADRGNDAAVALYRSLSGEPMAGDTLGFEFLFGR